MCERDATVYWLVLVHIGAKRRGGSLFNESCPSFPTRLPLPSAKATNITSRPAYFAMPIELPSFHERGPSLKFDPPTPQRGYLPQVNEKLGNWLTWDVVRVGGEPHLPVFSCTPGRPAL